MEATSLKIGVVDSFRNGQYLSTWNSVHLAEDARKAAAHYNSHGGDCEARVREVEIDTSPPQTVEGWIAISWRDGTRQVSPQMLSPDAACGWLEVALRTSDRVELRRVTLEV